MSNTYKQMGLKNAVRKAAFLALLAFTAVIISMIRTGSAFADDGIEDAFMKKELATLEKAGKLSYTSGLKNVTKSTPDNYKGVLLKGTVKDLTSGRIDLGSTFDFGSKNVGRIVADGLSSRGVNASLNVYMDDEASPVATFKLHYQMGKDGWTKTGDRTADALAKGIKGKHRFSLGISITGEEESKQTEILLRSVTFAKNTVPVMYFDIDETQGTIAAMNGSADHSDECYGKASIIVPDGYRSEFSKSDDKTVKDMKLEYIRGRGNSTWTADKKPYKVKFDKKQDLFGMGADKDWVLLANRFDNSFIRNRLTYWIGRKLGMEFTPECVPVEVVMNGEYYGAYLLCEQIKVGESRVNIDDLGSGDQKNMTKEPEITGGYLLSMNSAAEDNYNVVSTGETSFELENPDFKDYKNDAQKNYIQNYLLKTEQAIFGDGFKDKTGKWYGEYMDIPSAVDYWWIQEFSTNGDAFMGGSTYLYKKRNGKLFWGPLWDFDYVAWGDLEYDLGSVYENLDFVSMPWFTMLKRNETFTRKLRERWPKLKSVLQEASAKGNIIDKYYEEMKAAAYYDRMKWGFYRDGEDAQDSMYPVDYKGEVEQLRKWISKRISAVDKKLDSLKIKYVKVKWYVGKKLIKTKKYIEGDSIEKMPKDPKKKGYIFLGWYNKKYGYAQKGSIVDQSMRLKAKFKKKSSIKKAKDIYFKSYNVYRNYYEPEVNDGMPTNYYTSYTLMPRGSEATVKWSSSNKKIATVDKYGEVTANKPGTVKITAKLSTGKKRSYKIHFLDGNKLNEVTGVRVKKKSMKLKQGSYGQIVASTVEKPCDEGSIVFINTNDKVARCDNNGVVEALKPGVTRIMAYDIGTELYKQVNVKVVKDKNAAKIKKARARKVSVRKKGRTLKWSRAKGASGYYVKRADKKNGKYKKVKVIKKAGTTKWTPAKKTRNKYYRVTPFTKIKGKVYQGKRSKALKI